MVGPPKGVNSLQSPKLEPNFYGKTPKRKIKKKKISDTMNNNIPQFFYLQIDDSFHDLGDKFGGMLSVVSFMGQHFHIKNNQGRPVRGLSFNGRVVPFFRIFPKVSGCGGIDQKRELRFGGEHGSSDVNYFVLLFSNGVCNFYLCKHNLSNGEGLFPWQEAFNVLRSGVNGVECSGIVVCISKLPRYSEFQIFSFKPFNDKFFFS